MPTVKHSIHELAIILPCYNEEATISATMQEYVEAFPEAILVVVDNNSSDETSMRAKPLLRPQDILLFEPEQGKGAAMRTGLSALAANIYLVTDADLTYPAVDALRVVKHLRENRFDMVVGDRLSTGGYAVQNDRLGHSLGNAFLTKTISFFLKKKYIDVLSGLRAFSAPFVNSIVLNANGFQVETELNISAAFLNAKVAEIPIQYGTRPTGSESKLNTYRDGLRIFYAAFIGGMQVRPMAYFTALSVLFACFSLFGGLPLAITFLESGKMVQPGLAILSAALGILSALTLFSGLTMSVIGQSIRDKRIADFQAMKRKWHP